MKKTWLKASDFRRVRELKLRGRGAQRGSSLIELACFVTVMFVPILFLSIDFGRAYYMSIEVTNAARAGAQYAVSDSSATVATIQSAATADVTPDLSGMTAVATTGCMCSDGTSPQTPCSASPPTCSGSVRLINFVQVNTQITYTPIFPYPWLPSSMILKGQALFPTGT